MATQIFVNLTVKNLNLSMEFFKGLGYSFNPVFTNEQAACMIVSDTIYFMLVTEPFFKSFTDKEIADATKTAEVINCISVESKAKVDEIADKALSTGGSANREPSDYGWMYSRSFQDPDGHLWEVAYIDEANAPK